MLTKARDNQGSTEIDNLQLMDPSLTSRSLIRRLSRMKTNCVLETQTLIDENTTDIFGVNEDVEWLSVGDEITMVSLKQKKSRNVPRTKYDFVIEGYHHINRINPSILKIHHTLNR